MAIVLLNNDLPNLLGSKAERAGCDDSSNKHIPIVQRLPIDNASCIVCGSLATPTRRYIHAERALGIPA